MGGMYRRGEGHEDICSIEHLEYPSEAEQLESIERTGSWTIGLFTTCDVYPSELRDCPKRTSPIMTMDGNGSGGGTCSCINIASIQMASRMLTATSPAILLQAAVHG